MIVGPHIGHRRFPAATCSRSPTWSSATPIGATLVVPSDEPEGDCTALTAESMVGSMATKKVTVTIPEDLLDEIKADTAERGLSAYVAEALRAKRDRDRLAELADWLHQEYGPVSDDERAQALAELDEIDAEHARRRAGQDGGSGAAA